METGHSGSAKERRMASSDAASQTRRPPCLRQSALSASSVASLTAAEMSHHTARAVGVYYCEELTAQTESDGALNNKCPQSVLHF